MQKWFRIMLAILLTTLCLSRAQAESEVRIVIDGGSAFARPVAVVPFRWVAQGAKNAEFAQIIRADLNNSGLFTAIPVANMPQYPTSAQEVNAESWAQLGVGNVIVGQITPRENDLAVAFQLVDTIGASGQVGKVLLQKQYAIPLNKIRQGAHKISDEVFETLTGIRGAFRTKIAYIVQKNAGSLPYQLRIADYDGHNQHVIYQSSEPLMSPAWSADGKQIAYVSFEGQKSQLILQDLATGKRQILVSGKGHNGAPSFSPDGTSLAFASSYDGKLNIYVMDLFNKQIRQLTKGMGNNTEPSWSADSQHIVFTSDRQGNPQIYMMNKDGGDVQALTSQGSNYSGELMKDGKTLVMVASDHIAKKSLQTGNEDMLTSTFLDESPSLSPNDLMVIYSSTQGLGKVLQLVSVDGYFKARLPSNDGQVKFPAWSPYLHQR